jgi:hypothetical protein
MSYELIWQARGVIKRFFGNVTAGEVQQATYKVEGHKHFDDVRYVLNDFLSCDSFSFVNDEVDEMAAIDGAAARINPNLRVAVVATLADVIAAAEHYASSELNKYPTRIFATLDDARKWLGVPR